jgi:hypothetical protein
MTGAGILLYTYNPKDRKFYYLVQFVPNRNWIEDFGGIQENGNSLLDTAIEEFIQETNNVLQLNKIDLLELVFKNKVYHIQNKIKHHNYHLFIIPISSNYLRFRPIDFGPIEIYENIPRICKWMNINEIKKYHIHPRIEKVINTLL